MRIIELLSLKGLYMSNFLKKLFLSLLLFFSINLTNVKADSNSEDLFDTNEIIHTDEVDDEDKIQLIPEEVKNVVISEENIENTDTIQETKSLNKEYQEKNKTEKKKIKDIENSNFADIVILKALNKVTAKSFELTVDVGSWTKFERLRIEVLKCWKSPPEETPEDKVLIKIYETNVDEKEGEIFNGWMFSSSPGLSGLEHPMYDITVKGCKFKTDEKEGVKP